MCRYILDGSAFHVNNRKGFFELLDIFLRSPALPAYLAAAFIKRLSRLSLNAPPAGCMACIAFVHNLLRRHPSCSVLVHREGKGGEKAALVASDAFKAAEEDPAKCKALESSLWEMETLKSHYFPQVAKFVTVLDKDLSDRVKTQELPVGDVCAASYASLMVWALLTRLKANKTPCFCFSFCFRFSVSLSAPLCRTAAALAMSGCLPRGAHTNVALRIRAAVPVCR